MNPLYAPVAPSIRADQGRVAATRLSGRWLLTARALWLTVALLTVGIFIFTSPALYSRLLSACTAAPCDIEQLTLERVQAIQALGLSPAGYAAAGFALHMASALIWCTVAAVIFWRKSDDWMALCVSLFLVLFAAQAPINALPPFSWVWWVATILADLGWVALSAFFYLFPDGRFVPRWTWMPLVVVIVAQIPESLPPSSPFAWDNLPPLLTVPSLVVVFGIAVFAQVYRYRRVSSPVQRQQTKWVVFGAGLAIGAMILLMVVGEVIRPLNQPSAIYGLIVAALFPLVFLSIPLSLGAAMLRSRLYDIDPIINRTMVYGALTACVVVLYALVVGYLSQLFQTSGSFLISLVATGLVAVLFQPARERLQRGVNRLMYGDRDDPYAVLAHLGRRLEGTLAPEAVLPTLIETVAQALKLPYAGITLRTENREGAPAGSTADEFEIAAACGEVPLTLLPHHLVTLSLVYQGERVGQLILAPRAPGEAFSPADRRLLDDLARQAGVAVHAVRLTTDLQRLTADLQRSRERLVTTREEERRRLRRDLHDGLGPTLASLAQRLDTARGLVLRDPDAATALLGDLKAQTKATIAEIRRVAYALRPPALDELGLVPALREHAAHYNQSNGLRVVLEAPEQLPSLPAAVEVAAYHIVLEALTNVARHAAAQRCCIRLSLAEGLCLEITDDGCGLPTGSRAGVGLTAMRERAAELGGECVVEPGATSGTRVWARLPLLPLEV
ncbi:MAG TPA: GAF domain-containing sensor histidine kinase [Roseiflexaceae bacterium]|nr:GAF domain-containing sensor histidine kinase [Roseiflexaceae bacterium]